MKRLIVLIFFSIEMLCGYGFDSQLKDQLSAQLEKFVFKDKIPVRYYSNILIKLQGDVNKTDSLIFNELVDTLNVLIDKWDVCLIAQGTSNLIVNFNSPGDNFNKCRLSQYENEISNSIVFLNLQPGSDYNTRKKIIYYHIFRSLVIYQKPTSFAYIEGSIFSEMDPLKITFNQVDFEIIKELYSKKYEVDTSDKIISKIQAERNRKFILSLIWSIFNLFVALLFLAVLSFKGMFRNHKFDFGSYIKQGFFVVLSITYFVLMNIILKLGSSKEMELGFIYFIGILFGVMVLGMVSVILLYILEWLLLRNNEKLIFEILVPQLLLMFLNAIFISVFLISFSKVSIFHAMIPGFGFIIYFSICLGFVRAFYIYMNRTSDNIIRQKDVELARLSELQKQAELQSLQSKINPHFLYNSLNSIASLAATDARKTEQMALALSDFFKYSINKEDNQMATLKDEIYSVETYLTIEKVRFGDRLDYHVNLPEELENRLIPRFIIQPLVENAVKHGVSQITNQGMIKLDITSKGTQLEIRIFDNGPGFPDEPISGYGLQSIQEKIHLIFGKKAYLAWENGDQKHVLISLPLQK